MVGDSGVVIRVGMALAEAFSINIEERRMRNRL